MYAWLWRKLPGPWPVKALESLVLVAATCALLVVVVFPWVEPKLPFSDNVVDGSVPAAETTDPGDPGSDQGEKPKKKNKKKPGSDQGDGGSITLPGDG